MFILRVLHIGAEGIALGWFWLWRRRSDGFTDRFAVRLRHACERLGPTFMKLGQMSSLRPDFFPKTYCEELEKCLDRGPVLPVSVFRARVTAELHRPLENAFASFDETPLAAASLSQVHRATLPDGTAVVIKLLRPRARVQVRNDLRIVRLLVWLVRVLYHHAEQLDMDHMLAQLEAWLLEELDFRQEVRNMQIIAKELTQYEELVLPDVYKELSTKSLIVMTYVEGYSLRELVELKRNDMMPAFPFSLEDRLITISRMLMTMSLENGHFHGDLHPANIIITPTGGISLIDFGTVGYFDRTVRQQLMVFFLGVVFAEPTYLIRAIKSFSKQIRPSDDAEVFREVNELTDRHRNAEIGHLSMSQLLVDGIEIAFRHGYSVPWSVLLFTRTSMNVDGILLKLMPQFVMADHTTKQLLTIYARSRLTEATSLPALLDRVDALYERVKRSPELLERAFDRLLGFLDNTVAD